MMIEVRPSNIFDAQAFCLVLDFSSLCDSSEICLSLFSSPSKSRMSRSRYWLGGVSKFLPPYWHSDLYIIYSDIWSHDLPDISIQAVAWESLQCMSLPWKAAGRARGRIVRWWDWECVPACCVSSRDVSSCSTSSDSPQWMPEVSLLPPPSSWHTDISHHQDIADHVGGCWLL